jgi:hypothetical protein
MIAYRKPFYNVLILKPSLKLIACCCHSLKKALEELPLKIAIDKRRGRCYIVSHNSKPVSERVYVRGMLEGGRFTVGFSFTRYYPRRARVLAYEAV